jgi:hypothetical protein
MNHAISTKPQRSKIRAYLLVPQNFSGNSRLVAFFF